MDALRKEIEEELKRTRIDKSRIYDAILKLVDAVELGASGSGSGSQGAQGPQGPQGAQGPRGPQGPQGPGCECKCVSAAPAEKKAVAPKKTAATKKKVATTA